MKGAFPERPQSDFHQPAMHDNSRMDILNYTAYMDGEHKHLFDPEGLLNILSKAGFQRVEQRQFDPDLDGSTAMNVDDLRCDTGVRG